MMDTIEDKIDRLKRLKEEALQGRQEKVAKIHKAGRLTARERLDRLLDPNSFVETGMLAGYLEAGPGDGIIAGYGKIDGRIVSLYSQDVTVAGGSTGPLHALKMAKVVERAIEMQVPFIGLRDSPGARAYRLDEERPRLPIPAVPDMTFHTLASGFVPQISVILGTCAGMAVYAPGLTDFIFMVDKTSHMFITGPRIIKSVTSEDISPEELGGGRVHCQASGVADVRANSEEECFRMVRKLLSYLPSNCTEDPPLVETADDPGRLVDSLNTMIPPKSNTPYNMRNIILQLVDDKDFFELKAEFAGEVITGFGRMAGRTVGFIANQPMVRAGCLTVDSSDKQARFIRFCDAFNIPIVLMIDAPGYLPGKAQEHAGIIRHGAKVVYALCERTVPSIAIMVRKQYGGARLGMGTVPGLGTDYVFAWPTAEAGTMGAEQTVHLFYEAELKKADNPEEVLKEKTGAYEKTYGHPFTMVSGGNIDLEDIIEPRETRRRLIQTLEFLRSKRKSRRSNPKKHGNIPL